MFVYHFLSLCIFKLVGGGLVGGGLFVLAHIRGFAIIENCSTTQKTENGVRGSTFTFPLFRQDQSIADSYWQMSASIFPEEKYSDVWHNILSAR